VHKMLRLSMRRDRIRSRNQRSNLTHQFRMPNARSSIDNRQRLGGNSAGGIEQREKTPPLSAT